MEKREPQRGGDLGCAQVTVDPGQDRVEAAQLSLRVEAEDRVGKRLRTGAEHGEPSPEVLAHGGIERERAGEIDVRGLRGRLVQLVAPPAAIEAGGTAKGTPGGHDVAARVGPFPDQLLGSERPAAGRATCREPLGDPGAQAGRAERRGADGLEGGVEVPQIGRPNHHVGQEPGERRGLDRERAPAQRQGRPGHPATPPGKVHHHVVRLAARLDRGGQGGVGMGRGEPVEGGQGHRGRHPRG